MRLFYIALPGLLVAGLLLWLAFAVAPWVNVRPVPLEMRMIAPEGTAVSVTWDTLPGDMLPMVRFASKPGATSNLFLAELPPRPAYQLSFQFSGPVHDTVLRFVRLIDAQNVSVPFYSRTSLDGPGWFTTRGMQVKPTNNGYALNSQGGGELDIAGPIVLPRPPDAETIVAIWAGLMLAVAAAAALLLPLLKGRSESDVPPPSISPPPISPSPIAWPLWVAFAVAASMHLVLLDHSPVVLAGGDTNMYMLKAVALATRGTTDLTGYEWELNRLPGYPLFIAIGLRTIGYNLTHLAMMQGAFFCCAVMLLALSLRKWMHPWLAAAAIVLAILSPAQVWTSRTMLSESVFGSATLMALAAFFMHVRTRGRASAIWLILFACLATFSFFARPNGITLAAALVPLCIPVLASILRSAAPLCDRAVAATRYAWRYAAIFLIPAFAIGGWSYRNYLYRGFFGPSDMTGVTQLCGLIASGTFDIQCLADSRDDPASATPATGIPPLYVQYLNQKHRQGQYFPGFNLRHDVYQMQTHGDLYHTASTLTVLDNTLRAMVRQSKRESPWQVNALGYLRSLWWAVAWPDVAAYSEEGIRLDYVSFDNISGVRKGTPSVPLTEIRKNYLPHISPRMVYEDVPKNRIFDTYAIFANWYYNGWYVSWSILALLSAIYLVWHGSPALAAPMYVFVANVLLNVYLLNVFSRYIQVLDGVFFFEIAMGVTLMMGRGAGRTGGSATLRDAAKILHAG